MEQGERLAQSITEARDWEANARKEIRRIIDCMRTSGTTENEKYLLDLYADSLEPLVKP
jgi:hypothetical protein